MFLLLGVIISIISLKDLIKSKKICLLIFFIAIIFLSIITFIFKDEIPSIMTLIEKIKGMIYESN